jgi:dihydroorotase
MEFTKLTEIELPAAFDAHVHLRDGEMSQLVTPTIRDGGVNQVYVMVRDQSHVLQNVFLC